MAAVRQIFRRRETGLKKSLAQRLYLTIFAVSLTTIVLALAAEDVLNDDLEDSILEQELTDELDYFQAHLDNAPFQSWESARMSVEFIADSLDRTVLPDFLRGISAPFSGEFEDQDHTYLVIAKKIAALHGDLYISRDVSIIERRESFSLLILLGVGGITAIVGFLLAYLNSRQLVSPLNKLTNQILSTEPRASMRRLDTDYGDAEFANIAVSFNKFLDALEAFVNREKSFVRMASHELRTPLAVITGALDIIDQRDHLQEADRKTLARIRRAARDMHSDVEVLLKLARGNESDISEKASITRLVLETIADLESVNKNYIDRISMAPSVRDLQVQADPALIRMLIRNLLQNALNHTTSEIIVNLNDYELSITDFGTGIPEHLITGKHADNLSLADIDGDVGFGLLIVRLVCERLGLTSMVVNNPGGGATITVRFNNRSSILVWPVRS